MNIIEWTLRTLRLCREMRDLTMQALSAFDEQNDGAVGIVKGQMQRAVSALAHELPDDLSYWRFAPAHRLQHGWRLSRHVVDGHSRH